MAATPCRNDESEHPDNDRNLRGPRPARRPGRGPGRTRASPSPSPSRSSPSPTPSPGATCCGKAKTGSGKTLAFGLPLLGRIGKAEPRRPRALILVPDPRAGHPGHRCARARSATCATARCAAVYGGVDMEAQITALQKGVDVVVGTPGRLIDLIERRELSLAGGRGARRSTRPTAWPTWASCPRCRRSSTASPRRAPDDAVLGHARRRGRRAWSTAT